MEEEQDKNDDKLILKSTIRTDHIEYLIVKKPLCFVMAKNYGYFDIELKNSPIFIDISGTKYVFGDGVDEFDRLMKKLAMLSVSADSIIKGIVSDKNPEMVFNNPPKCNYIRKVSWANEANSRYVLYKYNAESDKYTITTFRMAWKEHHIFDIWSQHNMSDMPQVPNKRYAISDDTANRLYDIAKQMYEISQETFRDLYYPKEPVVVKLGA